MKVAIVGAGPAGLYCARLLRLARPEVTVTVFEQRPRGATWGFGVGLGARALGEVAGLDRTLHASIERLVRLESRQLILLNGDAVVIDYAEAMGALDRLALLEVLADAAMHSGAEVRYDCRLHDLERLAADYDLVVLSDGINSTLRMQRKDDFGTRSYQLGNRFAWYGVAAMLGPVTLAFKTHEAGVFVGHHYAYAPTMSTFVAECDAATWRRSGMDAMRDDERKSLIERVFSAELGDRPLIANNSVWRRFPVTTNERYFSGNVVLLGDALRGAHFSIGSGTRLAMGDAAALVAALAKRQPDLASALLDFQTTRKVARDVFGKAAQKSFDWYEDVAKHMDAHVIDFAYAFMTRTGRLDDERLQAFAPGFHQAYVAHREGARRNDARATMQTGTAL